METTANPTKTGQKVGTKSLELEVISSFQQPTNQSTYTDQQVAEIISRASALRQSELEREERTQIEAKVSTIHQQMFPPESHLSQEGVYLVGQQMGIDQKYIQRAISLSYPSAEERAALLTEIGAQPSYDLVHNRQQNKINSLREKIHHSFLEALIANNSQEQFEIKVYFYPGSNDSAYDYTAYCFYQVKYEKCSFFIWEWLKKKKHLLAKICYGYVSSSVNLYDHSFTIACAQQLKEALQQEGFPKTVAYHYEIK